MNKLNILFISDEPDVYSQLKNWSNNLPFLMDWSYCNSPDEAKNKIVNQNYNLLFFYFNKSTSKTYDEVFELNNYYIQIPKVVIVDQEIVSEKIRQISTIPSVDLIIHPIPYDRFLITVNRCIHTLDKLLNFKSDTIFIKIGRKLVKFLTSEIEYIEADGPYSRVIYKQHVFLVNEKISHLEARLPNDRFVRIHKSFIISIDKITEIEKKSINIDKKKIPIGSTYKYKLLGFFKLLDE